MERDQIAQAQLVEVIAAIASKERGRQGHSDAAQGRRQGLQAHADAAQNWQGVLRRLMGAIGSLCGAAVLAGCSFPHMWAPISANPRDREPFPQALRACVATYDPTRLGQLTGSDERRSLGVVGAAGDNRGYIARDNGGYTVHGFSQPQERYRPVVDCMRTKGWGSYPMTAVP